MIDQVEVVSMLLCQRQRARTCEGEGSIGHEAVAVPTARGSQLIARNFFFGLLFLGKLALCCIPVILLTCRGSELQVVDSTATRRQLRGVASEVAKRALPRRGGRSTPPSPKAALTAYRVLLPSSLKKNCLL